MGIRTDNKELPVIIEVNNQILEMSKDEYLCWLAIELEPKNEKRLQLVTQKDIDSLLRKGLLIEMKSDEDTIKRLLGYKLIRQGLGIVQDFSSDVYCVHASDEGVHILSEFQMQIWRKANGCKTIGEILNEISQHNNKSISLVDFINEFMFLSKNCLVFIC